MGELKRIYSGSDLVSQRVNHLLFINGMMTQRTLAFRLGVKPSTVNGKISGRTAWNLDELRELSSIFGVTADYLMGNEPIESAEPVNAEVPAPPVTSTGETGTLVAGTGFEPATSGL